MEKLGQNNIYSQYLGNKAILRTYKGTDLINEYVPLYTPPVDWSDIITDCPENSIALYAGHTPITGWPLPYTKVGTPTITGSTYTSSDSNYLIAKDCPKYCTFVTKITTGADVNSWQYVLSSNKLFDVTIENGYLRCYRFNTAENIQLCAVSANTPYYIKADSYLDSEYNMKQFSVSLDGTDWTYGTANFVDNAPDDVNDVYVGRHLSVDGYYFKGSFDLSATYVKNTDDSYFIAPYVAQTVQYDNLGFTATCVGGYKVFIDGTQYGSTYASGSTCTITWSSLALTTGDDITTPTALKAHKIWVVPATEGRNITRFASVRVSTGSEQEFQGKLWIHFNLSNTIQVSNLLRASGTYSVNNICKAITAKNNTLNCAANIGSMCQNGTSLEYVPVLVSSGEAGAGGNIFNGCELLKSITLKNFKFSTFNYGCNNCYLLEKIKHSNTEILNSVNSTINSQYNECRKLQNLLPETYTANITRAQNYIHNTPELKDTVIDLRGATALTELGIFSSNSTYFAKGIKGVRVSNETPFDRANTTQIDVRYTNLDRSALVQLFNDLPYNVGYEVVGSPTITDGVASGFSSSDYLTISPTTAFDFNNDFEMNCKFTLEENFVYPAPILIGGGSFYGGLRIQNNRKINFVCRDSVASELYILASENIVSVGNTYEINAKRVSGILTLTIYKNNVLDETLTADVSGKNFTQGIHSEFVIGYQSQLAHPLVGSVDLTHTYMNSKGVSWFRGQPAMTKTLSCIGCTGNKLVSVGSPTIVGGVASGFSNSNYLSIGTFAPTTPWEAVFRVKTPSTASTRYFLGNLGYGLVVGSTGATNKVGMKLFCSSNGTSWDLANIAASGNLELDTFYYIRFGFSGTEYYIEYSSDGITYTGRKVSNSTTNIISSNLLIGIGYGTNYFWSNDIDLNNTYIKVNGETWFDINNCLLPEDKAIATNKNWTLTLS